MSGKAVDDASFIGDADLALGRYEAARAVCSETPDNVFAQIRLAIAYYCLARRLDAETELAKARSMYGDAAASQYAQIYAQWGRQAEALKWRATAYRLRNPGLMELKVESLLDPIWDTPQFKDIERKLNLPQQAVRAKYLAGGRPSH